MKNTDLQNALSNVDDKYITEAASYKSPARSLKVWRAIAIAACCVIAVPITALAAFMISSAVGSGKSSYTTGDYASYEEAAYEADEAPAAGAIEEYAAEDSYEGYAANEAAEETAAPQSSSSASSRDEKIIRTADVTIQSTEYDVAVSAIDALVKEAGGYYESKNMSDGSGYRMAYLTVRVPAENYDSFIEGLKQTGTITNLYENAEDVSDSYTDIESRLETARTKLARLQELLAQAEDMSDIITIEEAISDTEWEIDYYEGSLAGYDSRVSYSTVYINLYEVNKVEPTETPLTFSERLSYAFSKGLESFEEFLEDVAIWFAESWIVLLIVGLLITAAIIIPIVCVKAARRRRNK